MGICHGLTPSQNRHTIQPVKDDGAVGQRTFRCPDPSFSVKGIFYEGIVTR